MYRGAVRVFENDNRIHLVASCLVHKLRLDEVLDLIVCEGHTCVSETDGIDKVENNGGVFTRLGVLLQLHYTLRGESEVVIVQNFSCCRVVLPLLALFGNLCIGLRSVHRLRVSRALY